LLLIDRIMGLVGLFLFVLRGIEGSNPSLTAI
jgi:hypothetical protein